ncbi:Ig-like domain-containing protein [Clostridium sp. DMHC 10]|uniref:Ig-like domain-containing protein n=1 Tax=Clostridium sp. DMHC 10 TaxID=747377 RepID=UPI00069CE022|nr:Ig-like domain-containing protein [Clostridium sp. DMHC 10]
MNTQLNQFNALLKRSGKSCMLNNSTNIKGVFKEIDDKAKEIDTKYFYTAETLHQGDMITYNSIIYIVITLNQNINNVYCIYVVRECPFYLNYWCGDILKKTPVFVDTKVFDTTTTKYMQLVDGQVYITVQSNASTNVIALNDRIIKFGCAWNIIAIDRTVIGLLKLNCQAQGFMNGDDIAGEITSHTVTHTYTLSVAPQSINISNGSTQQITAKVSDETGASVTSATYTYSSDNVNIATVDSNGLVTAVGIGTCNITVSYIDASNKAYTKIISTTVTAPATIDYVITGNAGVNVNKTTIYAVKLKADNSTPTGNFTWSLSDNVHAQITVNSNTQITVEGLKAGQVKLTVSDGTNTASRIVNITNYY